MSPGGVPAAGAPGVGRPLPLRPAGLQQTGVTAVRWTGVPVAGGDLAVAVWGETAGAAEVVLAVHGLVGNALVWAGVAGMLDGTPPVVAPDLRGRGRSRHLPPPHGAAAHGRDLVAVLDSLGAERVLLVAAGTGAEPARRLATAAPGRVRRLVLVDTGPPQPALAALDRLAGRPLAGRAEHRAAWRALPGADRPWNRLEAAVVEHDAVPEPPLQEPAVTEPDAAGDGPVRGSLLPEALAAEAADAVGPGPAGPARPAAVLVRPEHGATDPVPAEREREVVVAGADPWTVLLGLRGADAVARAVTSG